MLLKFKYYHDSGMLTPYQSFTIAQNSHLSSKFCITSTDVNAANYNYCLEFVCYNTKNVPKTQYISSVLQYGANGIEFDIPNNLTQFRGHTDMQLTGYSKTDNTVVFKSVAKNCKAFEVEGSLCVLENSICDTPNVITEILNQLAYLTDIKNNLVQEFLASANAEFGALLCNYTWHTVNFLDRDILIASGCYLKGYKIHAPSPTLPADCRVEGGWYDVATNSLWDFAVNTVTKDTDLYYNYCSTGLVFQGAFVKTYTGNATAVYIPRYYGGALVKNISTSMTPLATTTPFTLYITDQISSIGQFALTNCLSGVVVHKDNPFLETRLDCLINKQTLTLEKIFASTQATTYTPPACFTTKTNCLFKATCSKLVLPSGLRSLASKTVVECNNLTSIEVPSSVVTIGNLATMNCINLKKVFITSTFPPTIATNSFAVKNADNTYTNADIYVRPDCLARYRANSQYSGYNILPISDDIMTA